MNENTNTMELKKVIRSVVKNNGEKDLKKHIYIIKCTLFYISRIVFIKKNSKDIKNKDILTLLQQDVSEGLTEILIGIESTEVYIQCNFLDEEIKLKLINIINNISQQDLTNFCLGELYDCFTTNNEKKLLGQVYTPKDIVTNMVNRSITKEDFIANPYFKVIDPACGGGYFLIECYNKIKKIIVENYDSITLFSKATKIELDSSIHKFILKNNIWGTDIDEFAIYMTRFSLMIKGEDIRTNIFKLDALLDTKAPLVNKGFDLVISNPPYIGHKKIQKDYRISLCKNYNDVYSDKGDISYCFFKKGYELLKENGKLSYITSRYFLESLSGKSLRRFIDDRFTINTIIDFYGQNVFSGIGVSPVVIEATNNKITHSDIDIYKRKKNYITNSFEKNLEKNFKRFIIKQDQLKDQGWILLSDEDMKLFKKIDKYGDTSLEQICSFRQGIITGYDKAFIVDLEELRKNRYESSIVKPWIKNSDISKYHLKDISKYILYTDKIDKETDYPHVMNRMNEYKDRLSNRRECQKGIRMWYELQWGREESLFKNEKIVFPYKADKNKFVISREEIYSSADIYFITIKQEEKNNISLEYLVAFLNSKLCEFYFKCIAKKLNDKLYEYYPNKLINLKLKIVKDLSYIEGLVNNIENCYKKNNHSDVDVLMKSIDDYFYRIYALDEREIYLIENY